MRIEKYSILFVLLFLFSFLIFLSATAKDFESDETFGKLINAKSLKCYLGKGCQADWTKGEPNLTISEWGGKNEESVLIFDSINLKNGTARLIGSQGSTDVIAFATVAGITFIEKTTFGNVNITTVFGDHEKNEEDYIFVHSRHMRLVTKLFPSQYHGVCKILE